MAYQGQPWLGSQYDYPRPPPPPQQPAHYHSNHYAPPPQQQYDQTRYQTTPLIPPPRQQPDHNQYYASHRSPELARPPPQHPAPPSQHTAPPPPRQSQPTSPATQSSNGNDITPYPVSRSWKGYAFALKVGQQPDRARMCGFGDKDRRPISPPPCIQLIIVEEQSGMEIDYNKVEDLSRFILIVDLADTETLQESNLVHHLSSASPAIGSTFPGTYPHTQITSPSGPQPREYDISRIQGYDVTPYQSNGYHTNGSGYGQGYGAPQASGYPGSTAPTSGSGGSCSRNLIGSLSATSFKLTDTDGKTGLWFIFQDLSIRTEGMFRLKFTFFDLMCHRNPLSPASGEPLAEYSPLLASIYSRPFQVWSAKKFPGVRATTTLSQTFADQGIKIPVRKNEGKGEEKKRKRSNRNGDDSGEEFDEEDD